MGRLLTTKRIAEVDRPQAGGYNIYEIALVMVRRDLDRGSLGFSVDQLSASKVVVASLGRGAPRGIAVGNAATQRRGYIRTLNDLGAEYCDAGPHGVATLPIPDCMWLC